MGKKKEVEQEKDVSAEPEVAEEVERADSRDAVQAEAAAEADPLAAAVKEAGEFKDRWLRLAAEFENYKKRTAREFDALVRSASEDVIRDLLPVLDGVNRALEHRDGGGEGSESFQEGVRLIMEQFPRVLQNRGLSEIEAVGQPFDPHYHEALMQVDSEEYEEGMVADVVERGYCLGEKVIRHAKVVVSRGKPKEKAQDEKVTKEEG